MSNDKSSCKIVGGELEKKIVESHEDYPCEIMDFIEEARTEIFQVINDDSLEREEAWIELVNVVEKWFGVPKGKGVLESIKTILEDKIRRKQKEDEATVYKKIAQESKRIKLE